MIWSTKRLYSRIKSYRVADESFGISSESLLKSKLREDLCQGNGVTLPPRPPRYINLIEPSHFTAGDQLVVPIGASHISLPLQEMQSREWERKKKEQTNNMLGLTQVQKESYVTLCMCRLTLVWILAKLLQSYWNADSSWLVFPHCSGPHLTRLVSLLRCRLVTRVTLRQLLPRAPLSNSLLAFPYPLPVTPRSQVQNSLSGFAPKQTKESSAWRTTYIVYNGIVRHATWGLFGRKPTQLGRRVFIYIIYLLKSICYFGHAV